MKQNLLIILLFFTNILSAQDLIGTPTSLIIVYNYPENHFYIQLKGVDKKRTQNENIFEIDDKLIQVKTVNKFKFIKGIDQNLSFVDFMKKYINWEVNYLEKTFTMNINSNVEISKTTKGRDIAFWTYDMPINDKKSKTETSTQTQKQLFVLTRVKDYLVGVNSPLFEKEKFKTIKSYIISSMDGIVESKKEIDADALFKQLNN